MTNTQENKKCCGECAPNLYEQTHAMNFCQNPFCECHLQGHQQNQEKCGCYGKVLTTPLCSLDCSCECHRESIGVVPSPRQDYCVDCGKVHGYHCPKENQEKNILTDISLEKLEELEKNGAKITKIENQESEWEKRFDEEFASEYVLTMPVPKGGVYCQDTKKLKSFIANLLSNQKSSLVEKVEELVVFEGGITENNKLRAEGANIATKKILDLLKRD